MPLFRPRTRVEILREMIARVIARSRLVGLIRNSVIFHVLASAADEDAEQYYQLANLRLLFSIDTATGSDLDERAAEIKPSTIKRRTALFASDNLTFGRPGVTTGAVNIPAGSIVAASDALGQIKYRTTIAAQIVDGDDSVDNVGCVALEAGSRGNVEADAINQFVSRIPGVTTVTNPSTISNGRDREGDGQFRSRLKQHVQSLSRGTIAAVESFTLDVQLVDGRRVLFAKTAESVLPTGIYDVYIDDGTGTTDEFEETFLAPGEDVLIDPALGGELNLFTTNKPIRDDGDFILGVNGTFQFRGTDYELNSATGQVELLPTLARPSGLLPGDRVTANYRNYIGLIQEAQKVLDGIIGATLSYPGVRAGGVQAIVKPAIKAPQTLAASAAVLDGFDSEQVIEDVEAAVIAYINGLDIGAHVIVAEIIERAMAVDGMFNFQISDLSGTFPAVDQIILPHQVARIVSANLSIT